MVKRFPVVVFGLLSLATAVVAELEFETLRVEVVARPDQAEVEVEFPFTNVGEGEARIVAIDSGCQCLLARHDDERIAPGGKSKITGVFRVGNVPGVMEKEMQVRVSEGGRERRVTLTVAVEVKELVSIEPRTVSWTAGEEAEERTFVVTMRDVEPIRLKEVVPSRPGFQVRIEVVEEGVGYKVHVKPDDVTTPALGVFRFMTDCRYERYAAPLAFGHVKRE